MSHAYCKCINSDKGGTGESPKIVASIKWAKSWAKLVVAPAPNLQNFILQKQVLASGDVASGCRVKSGSPMTVTRIFLSENVRVNGDWRYLSKIAMVLSS